MLKIRSWFVGIFESPAKIFLILSIIFGTTSAVLVPQLSINDETAHYLRSYTLATQGIKSKKCVFPAKMLRQAVDAATKRDFSTDYEGSVNQQKTTKTGCGSAASYSPFVHAPQAIGIFVAKIIHPSDGFMILIGRLVNLAFYITALYFIIKYVRVGKWLFVVLGLSPFMIHTAASLSGDVMNSIVVFAFLATIINLFTQKDTLRTKQYVLLLLLSALLALTKSVNVVLLLPLFALPAHLFAKNKTRIKIPFNLRKWALLVSLGIAALFSLLAWQKIYGLSVNPVDNTAVHKSLVDMVRIGFNTYLNPNIHYGNFVFEGILGSFSSYIYNLPTSVLLVNFIALSIALFYQSRHERGTKFFNLKALNVLNLVTVALFVCAVTYVLYLAWSIRSGGDPYYADGVQGRYFTVLLPMLIPAVYPLRKYFSFKVNTEKTFGIIITSLTSFLLLYYTFETLWVFN